MRRSFLRAFLADDGAAIAPLYALGIGALVTVSAVGFDYGRLAALDTELQNAADQAALAAATQLDGSENAMVNARDAANNAFASAGSAFVNETRFANDNRVTGANDSRPITSLSYSFYDGYNSTTDEPGVLLESDSDGPAAKVVEVRVNARRVFYALTPLVNAISSGDVNGRAWATLQNSTCNVPPLMFCLPSTATGAVDIDFPTDADIGKGLKMHMNANQADPWAPGNFGFLNIDYDYPNGTNPNHTLGFNEAFNGCSSDVIESQTGVRDPQADALNSRFDMFNSSMNNNSCDSGTGNYCPAENVRRDWVNVQSGGSNVKDTDIAGLSCSSTESNTWKEVSAIDTTVPSGDLLVRPGEIGFPMDTCFGSTCTVVGDADWDGDAWMSANHPGTSLATAAPNGTRWEVYNWELEDKSARLASPQKVGYKATRKNNGRYIVELYCAFPQPTIGTGIAPSDEQKDRRVLTVAAVDCTGLHGSSPVKVLRWVDLFLVRPANLTGADKEFFTEIIGPAKKANGDSGFQYFGRNKAVLIR